MNWALRSDAAKIMSGAQGVVERASAQLSKRINGLRRGKSGGVVERVTTALCGSVLPPEKPARFRPKPPVPPPRRTAVLSHRPSKVDELLIDEYFLNFLFRYGFFTRFKYSSNTLTTLHPIPHYSPKCRGRFDCWRMKRNH